MKILITGGLGHIGSYLTKKLVLNPIIKKIYILDNFNSKKYDSYLKIKNKKIIFIYGDLRIKKILKKIPKVQHVIHLASITNMEESIENKVVIYDNNLRCFKNIILYCKKNKSNLIHISSTSIYDGIEKNITENSKINPKNPYSKVKYIEEKILINENIKYITLRFGTICGISSGMNFFTAVNKFCFNAVMKIQIPIWGGALYLKRPYLSLSDAFRVIDFIIKKNFFPRTVFNIFSENKTLKEIIDLIRKKIKKINLKKVNSKIKQSQSFITKKEKFESHGLKLSAKIQKDIFSTIKYLKG